MRCVKREEEALNQRTKNLRAQVAKTYENYYDGQITLTDFKTKSAPFLQEIKKIEESLEALQTRKYQRTLFETARNEILSQNRKMEDFDEATVRRLVPEIYLQANGKVNVEFKLDVDMGELLDRWSRKE